MRSAAAAVSKVLPKPSKAVKAVKRSEKVNSLVRGLEVLKAFGKYHQPMTITEVAGEVGLTPASARRMLITLTELGYVEQNGRRFRIGPKVLDLGYSYMNGSLHSSSALRRITCANCPTRIWGKAMLPLMIAR